MFVPSQSHNRASDKLLAAASALVITGILMATAILPASPTLTMSTIAAGGLA
ncbi:MAG: hypothetical protein AAFR88_06265 [Pseudomonadota bacterium]